MSRYFKYGLLLKLFLLFSNVNAKDNFYIIKTLYEEENSDFSREEFISAKINTILEVIESKVESYDNSLIYLIKYQKKLHYMMK